MLHHHYLLPSWTRLDEAVSKGKPQLGENGTEQEDARREAFLMAMYSNALPVSQWIVPRLPLEGYRNLLDLGGGPGTYAAQFCLRNPGLEAIVFDLPASRVYAEKTIASFGLRDRIGFRGGDFFRDQIPGEYDVVWMSHILHSFGPDECRNLMGNAVRALRPGGLLLVHDFILDDSGDGPLFPALFALNMLVRTSKGRSYTGSEIMGLLSGAGLRKIRRLELSIPNGSGVIAGEKDGKLT